MTTPNNKQVTVSSNNKEAILPVKKKKPTQTEFPLAGDTLREQVLKAGGVTVECLGRILSKGIVKTEQLMEAESVRFVCDRQGKLIRKEQTPHLDVQLRAAKQAIEVAGGFPTRFQDGGKGKDAGVTIQIVLPWQGKDGQHVIEAKGSEIKADKDDA